MPIFIYLNKPKKNLLSRFCSSFIVSVLSIIFLSFIFSIYWSVVVINFQIVTTNTFYIFTIIIWSCIFLCNVKIVIVSDAVPQMNMSVPYPSVSISLPSAYTKMSWPLFLYILSFPSVPCTKSFPDLPFGISLPSLP